MKSHHLILFVTGLTACGHPPKPTMEQPTHHPATMGTESSTESAPSIAVPPSIETADSAADGDSSASASTGAPKQTTPPPPAPSPTQENPPVSPPPPPAASTTTTPAAPFQPVDVSPSDPKDRLADQEAAKRPYRYRKGRFDQWRFKGRCQRKKLKEYAYHMGAEHCFEQAGINDGGVAYIAAEFAAHSHELSVKANVPALAQGTKRDALETCIQKSINSMGKYWGGSKRPSNWNPNDTKKVCSLNYRITQTYEYKEHPRRWQDGPWQVRRPGDYQLKTYNLKTEEPCDAAAVATAIKPHFEKIKSCLSHAGRGLFGRHHYTFYINERGGMTASPARETNPKKSSQARRQAYRKQMREGMKKCQNAEDKKSCRDQLKVRLQRFLKSKNAGSTGPNGEGETNPRLGQVKAQCLGLPLQGSRYKDALGRAFKPHIKGTRRASSRRSPKPPKTVCRVDWQFEHTRSKAP